jgi:hypothetical protein
MKIPKGESKRTLLGNRVDREEYVKHLMSFDHYSEKLGYEADLKAASKGHLDCISVPQEGVKAQPGGKETAKAIRLANVEAVKEELDKAEIAKSTFACLAYDLFCNLL